MRTQLLLLSAGLAQLVPFVAALKLNITAISARNGCSTLECWQLDAPFDLSDEPGTAGSAVTRLGNAANVSYSVVPPHFDGGLHAAPHNQYVLPSLPTQSNTIAYYNKLRLAIDLPCHAHKLTCRAIPRWVIFLSGLAYITLPNNASQSAYVPGGEMGLIFAADTADVTKIGHRTQYPGVVETVALQVPTTDGQIPPHEVLYMGACNAPDVNGLRGASLQL